MANLTKTDAVDYYTKRRKVLLTKMMKLEDTPTELREWWLKKYRHLSVHSFDKDLTWCKKSLTRFVQDTKEDIISSHILQYDRNAQAAFEDGNIQGSNQALSFKERLLGLHKPESQTFIQTNTFSLDNLTDEQIDRILEQGKTDEEDE